MPSSQVLSLRKEEASASTTALEDEEFGNLSSWTDWGMTTRGGKKRQSQQSLFWNQWITDEAFCCLNASWKTSLGETEMLQVYGNEETSLKIEIAGGSDAPHFCLKLTHKPSKQVASLCFMAWTRKQPPRAARRRVPVYPACPTEGVSHSFSNHLMDVTWQSLEDYASIVKERKPWGETEKSFPLSLAWNVAEAPIAINLTVDVSKMSPESAAIFTTFQSIYANAQQFVLAVRCNGTLKESWSFFGSQPNPTPPPWWRYSNKTGANQHIINFLPPLIKESDLGSYHYSRDKSFELEEPGKIIPQTRIDRYLDERQYEVFTVGPLLREAAAQEDLYESYFNHSYTFNLITPQEIAYDLTAESTYVIRLRVGGREHVGPATLQSQSISGTYERRTEKGKLITSDESDAPPVPDVGTDVTIDSQFDRFKGIVETVEDDLITMNVVRTQGTGALVLNDRTGNFRFGGPGAPFVVARKAIQEVMWRVGPNTWLKKLLLAHDNNTLTLSDPPPHIPTWRANFYPFNADQQKTFDRACYQTPNLSDRVNLVQGPPGTGKSGVISMCALDSLQQRQPFLLVAQTHYAIQVCGERIHKDLEKMHGNDTGIWLIEHSGLDAANFIVKMSDEGAPWAPAFDFPDDDEIPMSQFTRGKIIQRLKVNTEHKQFSLTSHISKCLAFCLDGGTKPAEEKALLMALNQARLSLEHLNVGEHKAEDFQKACKAFDKVWTNTQEFYINNHARGIITTAASALNAILRYYRPRRLIVDEASQLTEYATVAVMSRFGDSITKTLIVGDPKQNRPFKLDTDSEFGSTTGTSLMERLVRTGVPMTKLKIQYRMHPDISHTVSTLFYESTLVDASQVSSRPEYSTWRTFHEQFMPECGKRHSIFVNVPSGGLYRLKKGKSLMNPAHLVVVPKLVQALRRAGARDSQIAVLTPYKGQLRLHRRWQTPELTMATVDSSQGKEHDFVLLDLVTPGGPEYGLGSVSDVRKMCAGLSRAKTGLLIVGNINMSKVPWPSAGRTAWQKLTDEHRAYGAVKNQDASGVGALMQELHIPGNLYEKK